MNKNSSAILEKVGELEKNLQELKVNLLWDFLKKKERGRYKEEDILKEIKRIRKQLWDEKYSKTI